MSHSEPYPLLGTSLWSEGIDPSLPGTSLANWSRGLGRHCRTALTLVGKAVDYVVYSRTHASTVEIRYLEEDMQHIGIELHSPYPT